MVTSMTGYGRGQASSVGVSVQAEIRSVNSRFLEVSTRLPRSLALRENEVKEIIRRSVNRGKISLLVTVEREGNGAIPVRINASAARAYFKMLNQLRKTVRLKETVKLSHLLEFSEIFEPADIESTDDGEWALAENAIGDAIGALQEMRKMEGGELETDFRGRIAVLQDRLDAIERISREQVPAERERLRERIRQLISSESVDEGRLEVEIALLADRLDVTEECVRFRSHNKFFLQALDVGQPAGRRLNFLVQEMHREANTIGSKSSSTEIAHLVVGVKEELEKIREQLQNVE